MKRITFFASLILIIFVSPLHAHRWRYSGKITRPASINVAASDATQESINGSDYICDGVADEVQINAAIQDLTGGGDVSGGGKQGGILQLSAGQFSIDSPIIIDRGIDFRGVTGGTTEILMSANFSGGAVTGGTTYTIDTDNFSATTVTLDASHGDVTGVFINGRVIYLKDTSSDDGTYTVTSSAFAGGKTILTFAGEAFTVEAGTGTVTGPNAAIHMTDIASGLGADSRPLSRFENFKIDGNKANRALADGWGIYVDALTGGHIDVRFIDVWFDSLDNSGISLGRYWNHKIDKCTFEDMITASAVEFRRDPIAGGINGPRETLISGCYSQVLGSFITVARGDGSVPTMIICTKNILRTCDATYIPGTHFIFTENQIFFTPGSDNTEDCLVGNTELLGVGFDQLIISENIWQAAEFDPRSWVRITGSNSSQNYVISDNSFMKRTTLSPGTAAIWIGDDTNFHSDMSITGNVIYSNADGIKLQRIGGAVISGNVIRSPDGDAIEMSTSGGKNVVGGNNFYDITPFGGTWSITDSLSGQDGLDRYVAGGAITPALRRFGTARLSASGGTIAATLADGITPGTVKTIYCENSDNAVTVSVANHETSSPEVGTLTVGEHWSMEWSGAKWFDVTTNAAF